MEEERVAEGGGVEEDEVGVVAMGEEESGEIKYNSCCWSEFYFDI